MSSTRTPAQNETPIIQTSHQLIQQAFQQAENPPIPPNLQRLLPWMETDIFLNETTKLQRTVAPFGLATGFGGAYSGYVLGAGFGQIIGSTLKANNMGISALQIYFGTVAYTPIAILIGIPTKNRYQYYVSIFQRRPELPGPDDRPYIRFSAAFLSHFLSLFAGIPFVTLQYDELEPLTAVDYIVPICAMIASYCAVIYVENALKDNLLNRFETVSLELKTARANVFARINSTIDSVTTMSNNDVTRLFQLLTTKHRPEMAAEQSHAKLKKLFAVSSVTTSTLTERSQTTTYPVRKAVRDFLGYTFGGAATYVLYGLAVQTSESTYDNAVLGIFAGIFALSTNALFNGMLAQQRSAQIYNPDVPKNCCPTLRGSVNQVLAFSAAAPSTYLAIIAADTTFLTVMAVVTFIGGGLAKHPGFEYLADEAVNLFENLFRADTAKVQRKNLTKMLVKLKNAIPNMHPDQVIALEKALAQAAAPATTHELHVRVDANVVITPETKQDSPSVSKVIFHTDSPFAHSPKPAKAMLQMTTSQTQTETDKKSDTQTISHFQYGN